MTRLYTEKSQINFKNIVNNCRSKSPIIFYSSDKVIASKLLFKKLSKSIDKNFKSYTLIKVKENF